MAALVNGATNLPVYNNLILDAGESYIWIRLHIVKQNEGFGYFGRRIRVDLTVDLYPNNDARVDVDELETIAEKLEFAIGDYIEIREYDADYNPVKGTTRYIAVAEITTQLVDRLEIVSFYLDFSDYCAESDSDNDVKDFMRNLELNLNTED